MTLQPISKAFFGVPEDDEHFNLVAAAKTYNAIMKMDDDEARAFVSTLAFESIPRDLVYAAEPIQKAVNAFVSKRAEQLKLQLSRVSVAKSAAGEDTTPVDTALASLMLISKAGEGYWDIRDSDGRFAHTGSRRVAGAYGDTRRVPLNYTGAHRPIKDKRLRPKGDKPYGGLKGADAARFQEAYMQIAQELRGFSHLPGSEVEQTYHMSDGSSHTHHGKGVYIDPDRDFANGRHVTHVDVTPLGHSTVAGASFDVMSGLGVPSSAALAATHGGQNLADSSKTRGFVDAWKEAGNKDLTTSRVFGRLEAGSNLLDTAFGDVAGPKAKVALAAGKWVGKHGPEAEQVLGPTARKNAYRYRGVEKKPSPGLQAAVASTPREDLIHGNHSKVVGRGPDGKAETKDLFTESPLIRYFQNKLPSTTLNRLHTESGQVPPSQGIIIDRHGRVVTEAVGYGDDWYLPFNLRNVGRLKGGEYVRTRTYGGPTTEDIYTGLVSGARSITVVSQNGVYTVEFDDHFRGSRRYNDKASRMVGRYASLLDTVQSAQVSPEGIPPDLTKGWEKDAKRFYPHSEELRAKYLKDKRDAWMEDPQMSPKEVADFRQNFIAEAARDRGQTPEEWGAALVAHRVAQKKAAWDADPTSGAYFDEDGKLDKRPWDGERAVNEARSELMDDKNPDAFLAASGLQGSYLKALDKAQREYKAAHSPLRLNGPGYKTALDALQEQFPYYIARVEYRPLDNRGRTDTGYVAPGRNRPTAARTGFFDPRALGGPGTPGQKIRAIYAQPDYRNRGRKAEEEKPDKGTTGAASTSTTPTGARATESAKPTEAAKPSSSVKADAAVKLYQHLTQSGKHNFQTPNGTVILDFSDPDIRSQLGKTGETSVLFGPADQGYPLLDPDEVRDRMATEDGFATRLQRAATFLKSKGAEVPYAMTKEMATGVKEPETFDKVDPEKVRAMGAKAAAGKIFDFPDVPRANVSPEEYQDMAAGVIESNSYLKGALPPVSDPDFSTEAQDTLKKVLDQLNAFHQIPDLDEEQKEARNHVQRNLTDLLKVTSMMNLARRSSERDKTIAAAMAHQPDVVEQHSYENRTLPVLGS